MNETPRHNPTLDMTWYDLDLYLVLSTWIGPVLSPGTWPKLWNFNLALLASGSCTKRMVSHCMAAFCLARAPSAKKPRVVWVARTNGRLKMVSKPYKRPICDVMGISTTWPTVLLAQWRLRLLFRQFLWERSFHLQPSWLTAGSHDPRIGWDKSWIV